MDTHLSINEVKYDVYCHQNGRISFAMLPPTSNVLKQHIIRVIYQTLIWNKCLDNFMMLNQPWESGWCVNEEILDVNFYSFHLCVIFNHVQTVTYLNMLQHF